MASYCICICVVISNNNHLLIWFLSSELSVPNICSFFSMEVFVMFLNLYKLFIY